METPIQPEEKSKWLSKTQIRLLGLAIFSIGLVIAYFFIYLKWIAIKALAPQVSYSIKVIVFVPMCIIFGLYYMLLAPNNNGAWKHLEGREKRMAIIAFIITVVSSAALFVWFKSELSKYGYE
jgi:hypothetical protein